LARASSLITSIAEAYGHRPGYAATASLIRRVMRDAGVVIAADITGTAVSNVMTEVVNKLVAKVAASAGEGMVAGQRMARLGIIAMSVCRPLPFPEDMRPKSRDVVFH
jgi:putative membrane protein